MAGGPVVRATAFAVALAACGTSSGDGGSAGDGGSQRGGTSGTAGSGQAAMGGGGGASNGGSSGIAGTAGSNAGNANGGAAGSSAGSGAIGSSESEACMAYAAAYCRRGDECQGFTDTDPYPCGMNCPDLLFAPGSTRTIEGLFACAETLATWPCEDVLAGRNPPCTTPGMRQVGEPCMFSSQCQTLACNRAAGGCGTCARVVAENGDCSAADTACATGFSCVQSLCRPSNPTIKMPGEPCLSFTECDQSNAFCNAQGICESYGGENETCMATNKCTSAFYCAAADHICRPRPGLDQPCGDDAASGPACASGLRCTAALGQGQGTCVMPTMVGVGADCTSPASICPEGAPCTCVDSPNCTMRRCTAPRLIGETCSAADLCHTALTCANGLCAPHQYQNIYENACEP